MAMGGEIFKVSRRFTVMNGDKPPSNATFGSRVSSGQRVLQLMLSTDLIYYSIDKALEVPGHGCPPRLGRRSNIRREDDRCH